MLNELSTLSRSLASRGIQPQEWHPWIQTLKKGPAITAELDPSGNLARISTISPDEVAGLRNIAPDFHNSFPAFNLKCPVRVIEDSSLWNQPDAQWERARSLDKNSSAYETKDLQRLRRLLQDFPSLEIAPRLEGDAPQMQSTIAIIERLRLAKIAPETFLDRLAMQLVTAVQQSRIPRDLALAILYGKPNKKKLSLEEWRVTVVLEVLDVENFPYRVADPANARVWSALLLQFDTQSTGPPHSTFICSLTGKPDTPAGDKMPNPPLGELGPTYLMSMNKNIPCQTRYGMTSTAVFRVGKTSIQQANDAIQFVTGPSLRDKTWTSVPNAVKDERDLLLTYIEEEPKTDVEVVRLFADIESSSELEFTTYERRTAAVYEALKRLERPNSDLHLRVIALSKIDKGRKQVILSERYSLAAIYQGRDTWIAGSRNVPLVPIPFPVGKGKPAEWRSAYQPSPTEVMISFRRQWLRAGQSSQPVPGVDLRRIYGVFLEPDAGIQAVWLLGRYLPLTEPLLIGLARSLSGGASLPDSARKEALIAIAVYGILLLRQQRTKETYMENRDYLLGQFLQFADLLHKLYCTHERGGSVPPQLIGNAAIPMAMQRPTRALEVLSTRMTVYLAWAERYQGDAAGLAKWTRKELGRLAAQLKECDLAPRVSSNGKAELLLGYLARTKDNQKDETSL